MIEFPIRSLMHEQACYNHLLEVLHPQGLHCPQGHALPADQAPHDKHRAPIVDYRCRSVGYLLGVSEPTARRTVKRMLPALEATGRATSRWPNREQGRSLPEILEGCPELAVIIDSFEQRVRPPKDREKASKHDSGKKKQVTRKTQVCVGWDGHVCHLSESVPGPTADITLVKETQVLEMLPKGVGAWGGSAYQGMGSLHPRGLGAHPRRKPRGKPRPVEDKMYNTAFAR